MGGPKKNQDNLYLRIKAHEKCFTKDSSFGTGLVEAKEKLMEHGLLEKSLKAEKKTFDNFLVEKTCSPEVATILEAILDHIHWLCPSVTATILKDYDNSLLFTGKYHPESQSTGEELELRNAQSGLLSHPWFYISPPYELHQAIFESLSGKTVQAERWKLQQQDLVELIYQWLKTKLPYPGLSNPTTAPPLLLLLWDAGSGKSTFIKFLLKNIFSAKESWFNKFDYLGNDSSFVFYFHFRDTHVSRFMSIVKQIRNTRLHGVKSTHELPKFPIFEAIKDLIYHKWFLGTFVSEAEIKQQLFNFKRILFVFDALDEWEYLTDQNHYIQFFLEEVKHELYEINKQQGINQRFRCLITSRQHLIAENSYRSLYQSALIIKLCPFSAPKQTEWIEAYHIFINKHHPDIKYAEPNKDTLIKIHADKNNQYIHLKELLTTPVLLNVIAVLLRNKDLFNDIQPLFPTSKTQLYDQVLTHIIQRKWESDDALSGIAHPRVPTDLSAIRKVLRAIAHEMSKNGERTIHLNSIKHIEAKFDNKIIDLEDSIAPILLYYYFEAKKENIFEFVHSSFQEFLTAEYLFDNLIQNPNIDTILKNTADNWQSVLSLLYSEQFSNNRPFAKMVLNCDLLNIFVNVSTRIKPLQRC